VDHLSALLKRAAGGQALLRRARMRVAMAGCVSEESDKLYAFPVPSLYLPCTFPVPSLYLPCVSEESDKLYAARSRL
jgi:hypothetical protein